MAAEGLGHGASVSLMGTLRLTAITSDDVAKMLDDRQRVYAAKPTGGRYEAPRRRREKVPPPPDYSTPQAVTARCREAGGGRWDPRNPERDALIQNTWLRASWAAEKETTVARAYRAFMKACGDWRDPHPLAPHLPGVGRAWSAKRMAAELAKIRKGRGETDGRTRDINGNGVGDWSMGR